jgi:hypothetical protein
LDLQLESGRFAYFRESRPGEFTIYLVRHRALFYRREDYEEVRQFLAAPDEALTLLTGQVRWWKGR